MTSHIKIKLELNSSNMIEVLEAHQGDKNSRFIDVMLTSDGEILQIDEGISAKYDATIDNLVVADDLPAIVDATENIITVELTENMLSMSGLLKIDLKILESSALITAQTFRVKVGKSVINSDSKFTPTGATIQQTIDEVAAARGSSPNLKEAIALKADKATTLGGYGITNAYTKTEVDTALSGKVDNTIGLKFATTNNIDDCTDDKTLYRVYIMDGSVSNGYHNLICINQTYRKAQYLFAQDGKIQFRVSSKNSDGEWSDWSEWFVVVNDTDLSNALATKADTATTYTKTEVDTKLSSKPDKATSLKGYGITNAYTKTEVDTALSGKADNATTLGGYGITDAYTKTEVDEALADKPGLDDVYSVEEADEHFLSKYDAGNTYATKESLFTKADKATTLGGYGITDAYTKTEADTALKKQISRNIFDGEQEPLVMTISASGALINTSSANRLLIAKCTPDTEYCIQYFIGDKIISKGGYVTEEIVAGQTEYHSLFINSDGTFFTDKDGNVKRYYVFTTPSDALYIVLHISSSVDANEAKKGIQIELGNTPTDWIAHEITGIDVNVEAIKALTESKADKATSLAGYGIADGENIGNKKSVIDFYNPSESDYPSIAGLNNYHSNYVEPLYADIDNLEENKANSESILKTKLLTIPSTVVDVKSVTGASNSRQRQCLIKGKYLYFQDSFAIYKIDVSDEYNPTVINKIALDEIRTAVREYYATTGIVATGIKYYNDKIVVGVRITSADTSSSVVDEAFSGALIMIDEATFTITSQLLLTNKQMVASLQLYDDVAIIGLIHHGWAAYKITDTGFNLLYYDDGNSITTTGAEWQFASCDSDNNRIVFSVYAHGLIVYNISYDGITFSASTAEQLLFSEVAEFGASNKYIHTSFANCVKGDYVYATVSVNYAYTGTDYDKSGLIVAKIGDMQNTYKVYPFSDKPSAETSRQDQAPISVDTYNNMVIVNAGDKGVVTYHIKNNGELIECGRFCITDNLAYGVYNVGDGRLCIAIREQSKNLNEYRLFKVADLLV